METKEVKRPKAIVLEAKGITKYFRGQRVLFNAELSLNAGEVHGLIGHNGSGKSTLVKILAGYHSPEAGGRLSIGGRNIPLPALPRQVQRAGVGFVHQDLGLASGVSVLENFMMTSWSSRQVWHIQWGKAAAWTKRWFEDFGVSIDPEAVVDDLPLWDRALVAVVRAVKDISLAERGTDGCRGVLVLDEVTAFLPKESRARLAEVIGVVAAQGVGVLFVSHDLEEILNSTDRVTVLRDGEVFGCEDTSYFTEDRLVELVAGRSFRPGPSAALPAPISNKPALRVEGVSGGKVKEISFVVQPGECVGLTGVVGSGVEQVPYLLFGATDGGRGKIWVGEVTYELDHFAPHQACTAGIGLVPAERLTEGAVSDLPIEDNITLRALSACRRRGILNRGAIRDTAEQLISRFSVKCLDSSQELQELSGGNQQKVIIAKWLSEAMPVMIFAEPTRGVDVGARAEIFDLIRRAQLEGASIVCASSDHKQLSELCHRVIVMRDGLVVAILEGPNVSKEEITSACYGSAASLAPDGESADSGGRSKPRRKL